MTWIHLVSPYCSAIVLPIPQHGLLKDPPSLVAICTPQGLAVKVTCMQDCRRISPACIGRELPFQLSMFVHHLAWPESLGIIAWLLHCSYLAVCAKNMAGARPRLIVAMNTQTLCLTLCQTTCLSASSTCLHTCMCIHIHVFQVIHIWSCLPCS
jgi:hypothetical protein